MESIRQQTYPHTFCIIIDDCSDDSSGKLIDNFINKNRDCSVKFRLIRNDCNLGQLGSFLRGIREAENASYISFIDADDILYPDFVATHVQVHLAHNVAMTCSGQIEIDGDSHIQSLLWNDYSRSFIPTQRIINLLPSQDLSSLLHREIKTNYKILCQVANIHSHHLNEWHWGQTSSVMCRANLLNYFLYADGLDDWRICADHLMFKFLHLIGDSCLFNVRLMAYRRHGQNCFARDHIIGSNRLLLPAVKTKRKDNTIFARDILKILQNGRSVFLNQFGTERYTYWVKNLIIYLPVNSFRDNYDLLASCLAPSKIAGIQISILRAVLQKVARLIKNKFKISYKRPSILACLEEFER